MTDATTIQAETSEAPETNRRKLAKRQTREKVVTAATALFLENGYEGATIRDIATACKMSTGAVFANFADKDELFAACMGRLPVREAEGCRALNLLRALVAAPITDGDHVDQLAAIELLRYQAAELLGAIAFPVLPRDQVLDPEEHSLVEVMNAAIGVRP